MASHKLVKLGGHRRSGSEDIMILGCRVSSQYHLIEGSCNFMSRNSSRYVTILPSLVAIDTVVVKK